MLDSLDPVVAFLLFLVFEYLVHGAHAVGHAWSHGALRSLRLL